MRLLGRRKRAIVFAFYLAGCGTTAADPVDSAGNAAALRALSTEEALQDFDAIVSSYRAMYGPLERKQIRYGFNFDELVINYRARAAETTTDSDFVGVLREFNARFKDPHISLSAQFHADDYQTFKLPLTVVPVEDTYIVDQVMFADPMPPANTDVQPLIARGEELLSIDDVAASELAASFEKFIGAANALSAKDYAAGYLTLRSGPLAKGLYPDAPATLRLRNASGEERTLTVTWKVTPNSTTPPVPGINSNDAVTNPAAVCTYEAELAQNEGGGVSVNAPWFFTPEVTANFSLTTGVRPSSHALEKYGLSLAQVVALNYYAATYQFEGKNILFLRLPDYSPSLPDVALNYLRALLDEQSPQVDGLVLDQTRNSGGLIGFAGAIVTLLSSHTFNGIVQAWNADRFVVQKYAGYAQTLQQAGSPSDAADAALAAAEAELIDRAYTSSQPLSPPVPFAGSHSTEDADPSHWTKALIVLADERSGSAADMVPLLIQGNHIAPVFGQRTMGAGGSVEAVATLPNSGLTLRLSRGLSTMYDPSGQYPDDRYIEDLGVTPDIAYSHTVADVRAGYVGYMEAFSRALVAECDRNAAEQPPE